MICHSCESLHFPDRREVLECLAEAGLEHIEDRWQPELAAEKENVRNFSEECRFWAAAKPTQEEWACCGWL